MKHFFSIFNINLYNAGESENIFNIAKENTKKIKENHTHSEETIKIYTRLKIMNTNVYGYP